jgi:hypothetical protein
MHTVEVLDDALRTAARLGYAVRQEWLEGAGGYCEFQGKRWIFLDLSQSAAEQLEEVLGVLRCDPNLHAHPLSPVLRRLCEPRRAA